MKKLAVCVLTHEHPGVVKDVLSKSIEDYYNCGIDIYYYDSSTTDETERVIGSFVTQGYGNLHYIKVNCGYGEKIDLVYSGYGFVKKYDYVWPTKDRSFASIETLYKVMEAMEEEHDFIMLGISSRRDTDSLIYVDAKTFYRDWGVTSTSLNTLIYKYSSVLEDYDADIFLRRYPEGRIDDWRVFVYIYNRLYELEEYSIKVLTGVLMYETTLGKSMWVNRTFSVWKDDWIRVNDSLPSYYDEYKAYIIKAAPSLPWIMGGVERLQELHELGVLTPENFEDVRKDWERVSDIPIQKVREIAYGVYDCYHDLELLQNENKQIVNILIKLEKFVREGKMNKEEIPLTDVAKCVLAECDSGRIKDVGRKNLIKGSVKDILELMGRLECTDEMVCMYIQMLINYILLLE